MGQKTNPIGNRLGIIRGWESNWYGGNDYGDKLAEDDKIRKYIFVRLVKASVSRVIIERTLRIVTITITTARPGIIIGKGGQEVDKLKEELKKITSKDIQLNIASYGGVVADAFAIYDVTNPLQPVFVKMYKTGDAPEGVLFIPASKSPIQQSLIVVSSENDGFIKIYKANKQ